MMVDSTTERIGIYRGNHSNAARLMRCERLVPALRGMLNSESAIAIPPSLFGFFDKQMSDAEILEVFSERAYYGILGS